MTLQQYKRVLFIGCNDERRDVRHVADGKKTCIACFMRSPSEFLKLNDIVKTIDAQNLYEVSHLIQASEAAYV